MELRVVLRKELVANHLELQQEEPKPTQDPKPVIKLVVLQPQDTKEVLHNRRHSHRPKDLLNLRCPTLKLS